MGKQVGQDFDADRLFENAIESIKLGIEDFKLSQLSKEDGGNPARSLSSVRNLFAGLLLIFKHKIATSVDTAEEAYQLIFNPPAKILPGPDGAGGIVWKPEGKFKQTTIDFAQIKERFGSFEIEVDWKKVEEIQHCRNHLEHLHPQHTYGEVSGIVADLFPILDNFIRNQLQEVPKTVLGSAWETMLEHSEFYSGKLAECVSSWVDADVPEGMVEFIDKCSCEQCGSKLLRASEENLDAGETVSSNEDIFSYSCIACGEKDLIYPVLLDTFHREFFYWPPDGDEPTYDDCHHCDHNTFVIAEQSCRWCGEGLDYEECTLCGEALTQDDQENGGLCGYHNHMCSKY